MEVYYEYLRTRSNGISPGRITEVVYVLAGSPRRISFTPAPVVGFMNASSTSSVYTNRSLKKVELDKDFLDKLMEEIEQLNQIGEKSSERNNIGKVHRLERSIRQKRTIIRRKARQNSDKVIRQMEVYYRKFRVRSDVPGVSRTQIAEEIYVPYLVPEKIMWGPRLSVSKTDQKTIGEVRANFRLYTRAEVPADLVERVIDEIRGYKHPDMIRDLRLSPEEDRRNTEALRDLARLKTAVMKNIYPGRYLGRKGRSQSLSALSTQ